MLVADLLDRSASAEWVSIGRVRDPKGRGQAVVLSLMGTADAEGSTNIPSSFVVTRFYGTWITSVAELD